jgi:hypothetical protein
MKLKIKNCEIRADSTGMRTVAEAAAVAKTPIW